MRAGCRPFVQDDKQRVERLVDNNGNGDLSSGGSEYPGVLSGNAFRPVPPSAHIDGVRTQNAHTIMRSCVVYKVVGSLRLGWRSIVAGNFESA
jgi:hypothetical protein